MKSNVYTRTGDGGTTSLVGGTRVAKDSLRLEAYGTVDELNSWIGLLLTTPEALPGASAETLTAVQHCLFDLGAILATEPESRWQPRPLAQAHIEALESAIDALDATLPRHNRFILPGGHPQAANANIARTVARRAERRIITLAADTPVPPTTVQYINRLSDYLFILGRAINIFNKKDEIFWQQDC